MSENGFIGWRRKTSSTKLQAPKKHQVPSIKAPTEGRQPNALLYPLRQTSSTKLRLKQTRPVSLWCLVF